MANQSWNGQQAATDAINNAKSLGKSIYDSITSLNIDPRTAGDHAARGVSTHLTLGSATKWIVDAGFTVAAELLSDFFAVISDFRHEESHTFDATVVEVVNEFLGTEMDASIMKTGSGGDETIQKANAIGTAVINRLEQEFTSNGTVTLNSAAAGARTFAGYGVNFAIQNALISLIGSLIPETRLDDLRELGVEVAQNLGLGRLMARALRPLVDVTISRPYQRQLQAKYRSEVLSAAELVHAILAGRMDETAARTYLNQHGLSDDQSAELIEQMRPRLKPEEINLLTALGKAPGDDEANEDVAKGLDSDWIDARQTVETWKRLGHARERILSAVLSQISNGFLAPTDLDKAMSELALPQDEQQLWRIAAGYLYERTRKRMSQADMLFLFEAAQITQNEVQAWATSEGYSDDDVQRIVLLFELKAAEASNKTSGGAAAKASHLHNEHVAFMTDLISGLWGRAPSAAELNYWVNLLDTSQRTKADVKNELKELPSTGPAMPS